MTISGENKVVRTVCRFAETADREAVSEDLAGIEARLTEEGFTIQTRRACFKDADIAGLLGWEAPNLFLSVGRLDRAAIQRILRGDTHLANKFYRMFVRTLSQRLRKVSDDLVTN